MTALYLASDNGHDEAVKVLLAAKATVNTQDKVSFVVQTLCSQHAVIIVSHYVQFGQTPLWAASFSGHLKCVELLIVSGANVDMQKEVSVSSCTHTSENTDCSLTMFCWSVSCVHVFKGPHSLHPDT